MHILYHHRTLADGAEGIHIAEIIGALEQLGHSVTLACPQAARRAASNSSVKRRGVSLVRIKAWMPAFLVRVLEIVYNAVAYWRVAKAIRRERPAFMYERYSCFSFGGVLAARQLQVPVILEVNATYAGEWGSRHSLYFAYAARRIEQYVLNRAAGIVVVSNALRDDLVQAGVSAEKICVSPNAINPDKVRELDFAGRRQEIRERLKLDRHIVIGFVGSLRQWHGIDFFTEVLKEMIQREQATAFLIVGSGELEADLRAQIEQHRLHDRVVLTGRVSHSEVFAHIAAMDIAVMPDSNEFGSPMKILEYMALARPTVAPSLGPIQELIVDHHTGRLFPRRNQQAMRECLTDLARDAALRERLGRNARKYVLEHRTWVHNARQVLELFDAVTNFAPQPKKVNSDCVSFLHSPDAAGDLVTTRIRRQ